MAAGGRRLERWLDDETRDDVLAEALEALLAVCERSWPDKYEFAVELTRDLQFVIDVRPGLQIVVRFFEELPLDYSLIYIGHPDGHESVTEPEN